MSDDLTAEELEVQRDTEVNEEGIDNLENDDVDPEDEDVDTDEDLEDDDEKTGEKVASTPDDSEDLKTRLEELEVTNRGLIKSLSAQRGLRQDLQEQLDDIKNAIAEAKLAGAADTDTDVDLETENAIDQISSNIPVEFDDDGNMYIEPKYLKPDNTSVKSLQEEINNLKETLSSRQEQEREHQQLQALLSEKDGYKTAYEQVSEAWTDLKDNVFDAYLEKNNLAAPKTPDQAIDMIMESKELTTGFKKKYPSLDLESVLEANLLATPRYLRKALDAAIQTNDSSNEQLNPNKPASLANANSGGSDTPESLLNKVADMSVEDYESLDARTIAKIDKLLEAAG